MRALTLFVLVPLFLGACAPEAAMSLDEKLAGKSSKDKKEVLRLACLNEAEYDTAEYRQKMRPQNARLHYSGDTVETMRLKRLCREMADLFPTEE
jgi:hypothetical protein